MLPRDRAANGGIAERARKWLFSRASAIAPKITGLLAAKAFLTPRPQPHSRWETLRDRPAVKQLVGRGMYQRWGEGPPVALLHGWNGCSTQFEGFIEPMLAAGLSVVVIDAPGHVVNPGMRSNPRLFAETLLETGERGGPSPAS